MTYSAQPDMSRSCLDAGALQLVTQGRVLKPHKLITDYGCPVQDVTKDALWPLPEGCTSRPGAQQQCTLTLSDQALDCSLSSIVKPTTYPKCNAATLRPHSDMKM